MSGFLQAMGFLKAAAPVLEPVRPSIIRTGTVGLLSRGTSGEGWVGSGTVDCSGSEPNRALLLFLAPYESNFASAITINSLTVGGAATTEALGFIAPTGASRNPGTAIHYVLNPADDAALAVAWDLIGGTTMSCGVIWYMLLQDVDQETPIGGAAQVCSPDALISNSVSVPVGSDLARLVGVVSARGGDQHPYAAQVDTTLVDGLQTGTSNAWDIAAALLTREAETGAVSLGADQGNDGDFWGMAAVEVRAGLSGGGGGGGGGGGNGGGGGGGDLYSDEVTGLGDLVAYWRLGDADGSALADASGNGHDGIYTGSPTFGAPELTESWQASDGRAVNFDVGHGEVAHDPAFALAQGSISFWFRVNDLAVQAGLLGKDQTGTTAPDDQMAVLVEPDGTLRAFFQRGSTINLTSAPGVIAPGEAHHVLVTWSQRIVRLWLDGRQIAKSTEHTTGLTANNLAWRFGIRTFDDTDSDVALDEIALFSREMIFDEVQALSQFVGGLGYREEDAIRVRHAVSAGELSNLLSSAQPGDHIIVAHGTYNANFSLTVDGSKAAPIVVRAASGATVTIDGDFELTGDWGVLDGVRFAGGGYAEVWGRYCRVTRCRNESFTGSFGAVVRPGGWFARIDHSVLGPPTADSGGGAFTNQPLRVRVDGPTPAEIGMYARCDHLRLIGSAVELGNGRDIYSPGNTTNGRPYITLHKSTLEQSPRDEGISGKCSACFVQYCTFYDMIYVQNRHGRDWEWRSNYYDGCPHIDFGPDHWHIGSTFDNQPLQIGAGDTTQAEMDAGTASGNRPASERCQILGCNFINGGGVQAGAPAGNYPNDVLAHSAQAYACSGWNVTHDASRYSGTVSHDATAIDERFDVGTQLLTSEVGPGVADPLVPPGWK